MNSINNFIKINLVLKACSSAFKRKILLRLSRPIKRPLMLSITTCCAMMGTALTGCSMHLPQIPKTASLLPLLLSRKERKFLEPTKKNLNSLQAFFPYFAKLLMISSWKSLYFPLVFQSACRSAWLTHKTEKQLGSKDSPFWSQWQSAPSLPQETITRRKGNLSNWTQWQMKRRGWLSGEEALRFKFIKTLFWWVISSVLLKACRYLRTEFS